MNNECNCLHCSAIRLMDSLRVELRLNDARTVELLYERVVRTGDMFDFVRPNLDDPGKTSEIISEIKLADNFCTKHNINQR